MNLLENNHYCPECGSNWEYYVQCNKDGRHGQGEHCASETWCILHGCTAHCCGEDGQRGPFSHLIGMEYTHEHPEHYDGVSEWMCPFCETRWGRWTGKILIGDESEPRFGIS